MSAVPVQELEAITVRRARVADAGKVRYRVYSTPTEFIAVIAESALMAVKVAGVADPLRIVRDLPTEGVTLAAERLAREEAFERVSLATHPKARGEFKAELVLPQTPENFIPLKLRDLQSNPDRRTRILSADALNALIEKMPPKARPGDGDRHAAVGCRAVRVLLGDGRPGDAGAGNAGR